MSHPTRVRGLKLTITVGKGGKGGKVAPHAGAWIETCNIPPPPIAFLTLTSAGIGIYLTSVFGILLLAAGAACFFFGIFYTAVSEWW
ncbi:hypothetical protein Holit_02265 [Hollandina sp. SP2]